MYKFDNRNPLGKYENDCVIRSLSCATHKSWDEVYNNLSDIAQYEGTMMDDKQFVINYLDSKYERVPFTLKYVGQTSNLYKDNILLITMNGHICCSKYGVIYDTFDPRDRLTEYAWIVE